MSCRTCLNSEKQILDCVFDEDGKSLKEYLEELKEELEKLSSLVNQPLDAKGLKGEDFVGILQSLINKVVAMEKVNTDVLNTKYADKDNQQYSLNEVITNILGRLEILEKRTTNISYI